MTTKRVLCLGCLLLAFPVALSVRGADESAAPRADWWGEIEVGYGVLTLHPKDGEGDSDGLFYFGLGGGRIVNRTLWLGLECNGWLLQPGNLEDPSVDEGLMQLFVTSRIHLQPDGPWHFRLGGGYVSHWNNRPGENGGSGAGGTVGLGYDFAAARSWGASSAVTFSAGRVGRVDYQAVTVTLGLHWR